MNQSQLWLHRDVKSQAAVRFRVRLQLRQRFLDHEYLFCGHAATAGHTSCGTPFVQRPSIYNEKTNFGYTNIMFKPIPRVTANLGYNLTSTSGDTLILNPILTTLGPLAFNFHKPTAASVDVDLAKGFAWRTAWNYYDYNEKSAPRSLAPRDVQSNSATLSMRYAF